MCNKKELSFSIFMIYSLADKWKMSPAKVYKILNVMMCFIHREKNIWWKTLQIL